MIVVSVISSSMILQWFTFIVVLLVSFFLAFAILSSLFVNDRKKAPNIKTAINCFDA
ncbi:hypothetical protein [Oceanobacillus timonensis]|uniref:hypothetical protein n=1 Tax=Oceanobacillus timonensis TaxID=1926285 RepID=UPI0015C411F0|nr:hypothetical protein [Oceanobacillus timonensis]